MQIKLDPALLETYLYANDDSSLSSELMNRLLFPLDEKQRSLIKHDLNGRLTATDAFRKAMIRVCDQEDKEAFATVAMGYGFDTIVEANRKEFLSNPYWNILSKAKDKKMGNLAFKNEILSSCAPFLYSNQTIDPYDLHEVTPLAYFFEDFPYLCLQKDGRTWMSLHPHEIKTMEPSIKEAKGSVLTYGLGIGYYAFMVSEKEDVSKVTIVESDKKVLSLFKEHLLPHFPHKEKIVLVQGDAMEFAKTNKQGSFDYLFADLWHDEVDGLPLYLELRKNEGAAKKNAYWIEPAILLYLRRHIYALIQESMEGYTEEDYQEYETFSDQLLCSLFRYFKHSEIKEEEELRNLLSFSYLSTLAKELKLYQK